MLRNAAAQLVIFQLTCWFHSSSHLETWFSRCWQEAIQCATGEQISMLLTEEATALSPRRETMLSQGTNRSLQTAHTWTAHRAKLMCKTIPNAMMGAIRSRIRLTKQFTHNGLRDYFLLLDCFLEEWKSTKNQSEFWPNHRCPKGSCLSIKTIEFTHKKWTYSSIV